MHKRYLYALLLLLPLALPAGNGPSCEKKLEKNQVPCRLRREPRVNSQPQVGQPAEQDEDKSRQSHQSTRQPCVDEGVRLEGSAGFMVMRIFLHDSRRLDLPIQFLMNRELRQFTLVDSEQEENQCGICLEELKAGIATADCGHRFHTHCLMRWGEESDTCPKCRANIKEAGGE